MPALADPTTWRKTPYRARQHLFLLAPSVVFQAQINQTGFAFPLAEFGWDNATAGAYTDVRPGQMVVFGSTPGAANLGRQRVRKAPTATTFYIGWSSQGDHDGEVALGDNYYITVLDLYRPWTKTPYIPADGSVRMFKDYDIAIGDYGAQGFPVANGGPAVARFVDPDTELITVSFSAASSWHPFGASMTYAWDFADGTNPATGNSTGTGTTVADVTFPAGFRYVRLTATDSYGQAHTCVIPVYAAARSGQHAPLAKFEIEEHTIKPEGQTLTVRVFEDLPAAAYPDGTLAILFEEEWYGTGADEHAGSLAGPSGRENVRFVGWHFGDPEQGQATAQGWRKDTRLKFLDIGGWLDQLPGFPQVVEHSAAPQSWLDMAQPDTRRYLHYLLYWHSTALEVADFIPAIHNYGSASGNYPFFSATSAGETLYQQVDKHAQAIAHRLTCNTKGQLLVRPDNQLLITGERGSTVIVSLATDDVANLRYAGQFHPRLHWLRGGAVQAVRSAEPNPYLTVAPGHAPGVGPRSATYGNQLAYAQSEANHRDGARYYRQNAKLTTFAFELTHAGDAGIEPAYTDEWLRLTISAEMAARRGLAFTDARCQVHEVKVRYDHQAGRKEVTVTVEKELFPYPAQTVTVTPTTTVPTNYRPPRITWRAPVNTNIPTLVWPTKIVALMGNGHVARAQGLIAGSNPIWEDVTGAMTGTCSLADLASPQGTFAHDKANPARYHFSNSDGLWAFPNMWLDAPAPELVNGDDAWKNLVKLDGYIGREGYLCGCKFNGDFVYSFDNGMTYGVARMFDIVTGWFAINYPAYTVVNTRVRDFQIIQAGMSDPDQIGIYLIVHAQLELAQPNQHQLWRSTDGGATWEYVKQVKITAGHQWHGVEVPVFLDDGSPNTDGQTLWVSSVALGTNHYSVNGYTSAESRPFNVGGAYQFVTSFGNANKHTGYTQDPSQLAFIGFDDLNGNTRGVMVTEDGGFTWRGIRLTGSSQRLQFVNGYPYHRNWLVWGGENRLLEVSDDWGATKFDFWNDLHTVTGSDHCILAAADISDLGWLF